MEMDMKKFKNPPSIMRPTPFWAINDRITPEETARQMEDMLSVGLGGGFFHSRHGLITNYMGDEWFASMEAAVKSVQKKDGYLWLYDEDLWPSGNAGGQVAGMKDEYRATRLNAFFLASGEPLPSAGADEAIRYAYQIIKRDGLILKEIEAVPIECLESVERCERLVFVRRYSEKTSWWSGESYANLLHPEAVKKFMELTHDVYYRRLGKEFGKRIPGIFTDEPNIYGMENGIPWYEGIPEKYGKWTGRDFWKDLPYLFFDGKEARRVRLLVHRAILRQFLEAYDKPIYDWCEKRKIAHTGHYNAEDKFASQIANHCGGVMAHYRYQQIPGIDHLCRQTSGRIPILLTCKQVSSAARQLGRKTVLTEIFGVSRHTNTFEDFRWLGDYDLVLGANFFCPHLSWYSAKGRRKRDYPPVWNYQQTYWKDLPALNDYFTRIAYALTSGKPEVSILLLHSIESAIAGRRIGAASARRADDIPVNDLTDADALDALMRKTLDAILSTGHDCDLGDESFLEDYGNAKGKNLAVGKMSYRVVVVPPSKTWREKTVELLEKFVENGGILIVLGKPPEEIDGIENKGRWSKILMHKNVHCLPSSVESIRNAVNSLVRSTYMLRGADGKNIPDTYVQHRIDGKDEIFFVVNSDREDKREYVLTVKNAGGRKLCVLDAVDGSICFSEAVRSGDELRYVFSLPSAGSVLLKLTDDFENVQNVESRAPDFKSAKVVRLPDTFEFERKDANVLVLDRISISYDGRDFEDEEPEWRVRRKIAERFKTTDALQWQPWVAARKGLFEGKGGDIVLRYRFSSDLNKPKSYLVIEDMHKGEVFVNGIKISLNDEKKTGWHWDKSFEKLEITGLVKKGENVVDFRVRYDFLTEVEAAYVVGNFGVEMETPYAGKLVKEGQGIRTGSLVEQGYPFYSGRMVYNSEFNANVSGGKKFLKILNPSGILFNVRVNGADAGKILWNPHMLDITRFVRKGKNKIEVELVSSLQNSWGPLHERDGDDNMWVGVNAFENEEFLREEFSFFNYGIGGIEILSV
jgi:hypothetical protein